jgi:hypothetical protein
MGRAANEATAANMFAGLPFAKEKSSVLIHLQSTSISSERCPEHARTPGATAHAGPMACVIAVRNGSSGPAHDRVR